MSDDPRRGGSLRLALLDVEGRATGGGPRLQKRSIDHRNRRTFDPRAGIEPRDLAPQRLRREPHFIKA